MLTMYGKLAGSGRWGEEERERERERERYRWEKNKVLFFF
jgi:hypothetical protein